MTFLQKLRNRFRKEPEERGPEWYTAMQATIDIQTTEIIGRGGAPSRDFDEVFAEQLAKVRSEGS